MEKKKKMQLHTFLGLSGTEEPSLKGPWAGGALHPSCRHKYLALQEQLLALELWGAHRQEDRGGREGDQAPSARLWVTSGGRW